MNECNIVIVDAGLGESGAALEAANRGLKMIFSSNRFQTKMCNMLTIAANYTTMRIIDSHLVNSKIVESIRSINSEI